MEQKLSEKVYTELRNRILAGDIHPRDFISESEIAEAFGVSKGPVKDALHILVDQGYLIAFPRKGYMVNTYDREEINKMQEIRRNLEGLCVRKAVASASDDAIQSLRVYTDMESHELNPQNTVNTAFHLRLAEISGNEFLVEVLKPLIFRASMVMIRIDPNSEPDIENFEHIIDAMLERDEKTALEWLEKDISYI